MINIFKKNKIMAANDDLSLRITPVYSVGAKQLSVSIENTFFTCKKEYLIIDYLNLAYVLKINKSSHDFNLFLTEAVEILKSNYVIHLFNEELFITKR